MEKEQIMSEIKEKFPYDDVGFYCWSSNFEYLGKWCILGPLIPIREMRGNFLFMKLLVSGCVFVNWNDIITATHLEDIVLKSEKYLSITVKNFKSIPGMGPVWRKNN